jgi:ferrochelatase
MRYGNPSPQHALEKLLSDNPDLESVTLIPLYPHYAMSSYETAVIHVVNTHKRMQCKFELKVVPPFYNNPDYIKVLAESIRPHLTEPFDHLLFSYHGIPERHLKKSDFTGRHCLCNSGCCENSSPAHQVCYRHQVIQTTSLVTQYLGISPGKFSFSFQSRLGADAWLKPYTAAQLESFPKKGIKKLVVVCPAFVSDCLETLEEIQMEGKEDFMHHGGESYKVIPCLNEREDWIQTLFKLKEIAVAQNLLVLNR